MLYTNADYILDADTGFYKMLFEINFACTFL